MRSVMWTCKKKRDYWCVILSMLTYRQRHGWGDGRREAACRRLVGSVWWRMLRLSRGGGAGRAWRRDRGLLLLVGLGHVMLGRQLILGCGSGSVGGDGVGAAAAAAVVAADAAVAAAGGGAAASVGAAAGAGVGS